MRSVRKRTVFIGVLLLCMGLASTSQAELGKCLYEYWLNIPGGTVADLTSSANYPDNPDGSQLLGAMQGPRQWADNYGSRMSAYLIPPASGYYRFWIASDDAGELWLSTDDNPANVRKMCYVATYTVQNEFDTFPSQKSAAVYLQAGHIYYIMTLQKEAGGDDHVTAAWRLSDPNAVRSVIGGNVISDTNPKHASRPTPANRSVDLDPAGLTLSWQAPLAGFVDNPTYNVYIGTSKTSQDTQLLSASSDTSVSAGTLDYGKTYYWRVDVIDPNNGHPYTITGDVWHFATKPPAPVIKAQPEDQYINLGETADFTVVATSPYPITYTWKNAQDPNIIVGHDATLEFTNVQQSQDGNAYFCEVSNDYGTKVTDTVRIVIKRMTAHWPLDVDFKDAADGHDGTMMGDDPNGPLVVTNLLGSGDKAVSLNGTNAYIAVPYSSGFNTPAFTVAVWCKVEGGSGSYRCPVSNRADNPQRGWIVYAQNNNQWAFWTGTGAQIGWGNMGGGPVEMDKWTLVCITMEKTANAANGAIKATKRMYINGTPVSMATDVTFTPNTTSEFRIGAGANEGPANYFFNGLIDDVKMYNYALTPVDIANMYRVAYPDAVICTGNPTYDLNNDCKVDVEDLQLLVSEWLECYLVPDCL